MKYAALRMISFGYRVLGVLVFVAGVIFAASAAGEGGVGAFLAVFIFALLYALGFYGFGQIIAIQLGIEENLRRAADALEKGDDF